MSVKMKRNKMLDLWVLLNKLSNENLPGRIFKIFVSKNILVIKPEIELIQGNFKLSNEAQTYEEEKKNILIKYADRDSNGAVMFQGTNFTVSDVENVKKAKEELAILEEKNVNAIKEILEINKELEMYVNEEVELHLMKIIEDAIPENIETKDLTTILEFGLLSEV
jgi:hypothetical protein